jgi:hypothetical protein
MFGMAPVVGHVANYATNLLNDLYEDQIRLMDEVIGKRFAMSDAASAMLRKAEADVTALEDNARSAADRAYSSAQREIDAAKAARDQAQARLRQMGAEEMGLSAGMSASVRREAVDRLDDERKSVEASIKLYEKAIGVLERKQFLATDAAERGGAKSKPPGAPGGGDEKLGGTTRSISEVMLGGGPGEQGLEVGDGLARGGLCGAGRMGGAECQWKGYGQGYGHCQCGDGSHRLSSGPDGAAHAAARLVGQCADVGQRRGDLGVELGEVHAREIERLQLREAEPRAVGVPGTTPAAAELGATLLVEHAGQARVEAAVALGGLQAGAEDGHLA